MKVQAECIKPNFYVHIIPAQVFSNEMWEIFKNTFENNQNFLKHLRTAAPVKCYL